MQLYGDGVSSGEGVGGGGAAVALAAGAITDLQVVTRETPVYSQSCVVTHSCTYTQPESAIAAPDIYFNLIITHQ